MQYVNIETGSTDISLIINSVQKIKEKEKNRSAIFGTTEHEKSKTRKKGNIVSAFSDLLNKKTVRLE